MNVQHSSRSILLNIIAFTAILLVMGGVFSCSDSGSKVDNKVKIVYRSVPDWDALFEKIKPLFEKSNPGYILNIEPVHAPEGQYFAKVGLLLQSESSINVVVEDSFMLKSDATAGYLTDLTDYTKEWAPLSKFYPALLEGYKVDGKLFGIPLNSDTRGLFYNKDILAKVGFSEGWQPESWQDLLDTLIEIKTQVPDVHPFALNVNRGQGEATTMQTLQMLLYGTNDPMFDAKTGKWIVESQGLIDSFRFLDQLKQADVLPEKSLLLNPNIGETYEKTWPKEGSLGVNLNGNWLIGKLPENYLVAKMPKQFGNGYTSMSGGWGLVIPSVAKNKDAGWKFISFAMDNKDFLGGMSYKLGNLATREDVTNWPEYKNKRLMKETTDFLSFTHFRPANVEYPGVSVELQIAVDSIFSTDTTPEEAMKSYAKEVERKTNGSIIRREWQ